MKLFFASQFLIASLLMIWNVTKKGLWEHFPYGKSPASSFISVEAPPPKEVESVYLTKKELPLFDHTQLVTGQIPDTIIEKDQPELVSTFTTNILEKGWDSLNSSKGIDLKEFSKASDILPNDPLLKPRVKSPLVAAGLSLIPGLGHSYLEDTQTAGALMGSAGIGHTLFLSMYYSDSFYALFNNDENPLTYLSSMRFAQTTEFYGIFAAYRDARMRLGTSGYLHKMPTDNLITLVRAPFDFQVLKKPEVWGGILGAVAIAKGVMWLSGPMMRAEASITPAASLLALPVSVGEETFFRGFLQSELSEHLSPWGGIAATSALFAAAHIPSSFSIHPSMRWKYYTFNLPLLAGLGAYFGYLTHKSGSLRDCVAVHAWYDFALMASDALLYSASTGDVKFSTSINF